MKVIGLENGGKYGGTKCYVNTAIQCLFNLKKFRDQLSSNIYLKKFNNDLVTSYERGTLVNFIENYKKLFYWDNSDKLLETDGSYSIIIRILDYINELDKSRTPFNNNLIKNKLLVSVKDKIEEFYKKNGKIIQLFTIHNIIELNVRNDNKKDMTIMHEYTTNFNIIKAHGDIIKSIHLTNEENELDIMDTLRNNDLSDIYKGFNLEFNEKGMLKRGTNGKYKTPIYASNKYYMINAPDYLIINFPLNNAKNLIINNEILFNNNCYKINSVIFYTGNHYYCIIYKDDEYLLINDNIINKVSFDYIDTRKQFISTIIYENLL